MKASASAKERVTPERSRVALLLVDVINDFNFRGGDALAVQAPTLTTRLVALKRRARAAGIATIYVNDNFGRWRSDFRAIVAHCGRARMPGRHMVRRLHPTRRDYFVLKPMLSGFHATSLETLLRYLGTRTVIIAGITGDNCVLFTAADAHMRNLRVYVPADGTISEEPDENAGALAFMARRLKVDITPSTELDLRRMARVGR
jgi:nicotinamidase-related amidase